MTRIIKVFSPLTLHEDIRQTIHAMEKEGELLARSKAARERFIKGVSLKAASKRLAAFGNVTPKAPLKKLTKRKFTTPG